MVAILILLELTLQSKRDFCISSELFGRNPYFIGINSAMFSTLEEIADELESQSLFYWN